MITLLFLCFFIDNKKHHDIEFMIMLNIKPILLITVLFTAWHLNAVAEGDVII